MIKILVDGVFFQLAKTGIARVWLSLLPRLALYNNIEIIMLNRGNCPVLEGIRQLDFPSYTMKYTTNDSILIEEMCECLGIDVFVSTYYTTPIKTPQVLMVYDMIPEVMGFNIDARIWKEKQLAISYARYFACISDNTRLDLKKFYPKIDDNRIAITYCGVEKSVFKAENQDEITKIREKIGLKRDYFMFVGSREQNKVYKNATLFFDAIKIDQGLRFDVLCVGGEKTIEAAWLRNIPNDVKILRADLTDAELSSAYSGARALIYPSLYEGFGMPVIEAMACHCPVVTTHHGSLKEIAGDAALIISGYDKYEMLRCIEKVQDPSVRASLIDAGLKQIEFFDWEECSEKFYKLLVAASSSRNNPIEQQFYRNWSKLRYLQSEVDVGL